MLLFCVGVGSFSGLEFHGQFPLLNESHYLESGPRD